MSGEVRIGVLLPSLASGGRSEFEKNWNLFLHLRKTEESRYLTLVTLSHYSDCVYGGFMNVYLQ